MNAIKKNHHISTRMALFIALAVLLLAVLVGPFLIPVPSVGSVTDPRQLADPDSLFIEVKGQSVHYKRMGQGEPAIILIHGFASGVHSWQYVMEPLSQLGTVIAYDRSAFGLTERPMPGEWGAENPYTSEFQAALLAALMDALEIERAILVGHSAGGTLATYFALQYPQRVQALALVDAAIYEGGGSPAWVRPLLHTPQVRHLGPLFARSIAGDFQGLLELAWHEPANAPPELLEDYTSPLQIKDWDRALWELTLASHPLGLPERLGELAMPVLVLTGDDDRMVPTESSLRLAQEINGAELVVFADCGHVPQEERPKEFSQALAEFIQPER